MAINKAVSIDTAFQTIMQELREKSARFLGTKQAASEEKAEFDCPYCKDRGIIVYRVHKDTPWHLDDQLDLIFLTKLYLKMIFCLVRFARRTKLVNGKILIQNSVNV